MNYQIINADLIEWLKENQDTYREYFHFCLSDWPYNLESITKRFGKEGSAPARPGKDGSFTRKSAGFMGQDWDGSTLAYEAKTWELIKPLLKPGAFTSSFTHTRKQHRLACAQEDAGYLIQPAFYNYRTGQTFQVPAQLGWIYGSGMAHGTDISKAVDKAAGAERGKIRIPTNGSMLDFGGDNQRPWKTRAAEQGYHEIDDDTPVIDLAQIWHGYQYGGPLAPEIEPIIIAQKPWQGHRRTCITETGAGAMNIAFGQSQKVSDRFPGTLTLSHHPGCRQVGWKEFKNGNGSVSGDEPSLPTNGTVYGDYNDRLPYQAKGKDGIELIPDYDCHPDCHVARLGDEKARYFFQADWAYEIIERLAAVDPVYYCGKVGKIERNAGLDELPDRVRHRVNSGGLENEARFKPTIQKNNHPTLKPLKLTKYLASLFLPPPQYAPRRLLIPCCGTGSEVIGALLAGWDEVIGIELKPEYAQIAQVRVAWWADWLKWGQTDVDTILSSLSKEKPVEQMKLF